jgi:hypothetical protein
MIEANKLANLDLSAAGGIAPEEDEQGDDGDEGEEQGSAIREEVIKRLKRLAEDDEQE